MCMYFWFYVFPAKFHPEPLRTVCTETHFFNSQFETWTHATIPLFFKTKVFEGILSSSTPADYGEICGKVRQGQLSYNALLFHSRVNQGCILAHAFSNTCTYLHLPPWHSSMCLGRTSGHRRTAVSNAHQRRLWVIGDVLSKSHMAFTQVIVARMAPWETRSRHHTHVTSTTAVSHHRCAIDILTHPPAAFMAFTQVFGAHIEPRGN